MYKCLEALITCHRDTVKKNVWVGLRAVDFKGTMRNFNIFMKHCHYSADVYKCPVTVNETLSKKTAVLCSDCYCLWFSLSTHKLRWNTAGGLLFTRCTVSLFSRHRRKIPLQSCVLHVLFASEPCLTVGFLLSRRNINHHNYKMLISLIT